MSRSQFLSKYKRESWSRDRDVSRLGFQSLGLGLEEASLDNEPSYVACSLRWHIAVDGDRTLLILRAYISSVCILSHIDPAWGRGTPFPPFLFPCPFTSLSFALFYLFPFSFHIRFTYFLLSSIPLLSTRIVPLRFQARGRSRRPNLGSVCFVHFVLSSAYCLVKIYSGVLL